MTTCRHPHLQFDAMGQKLRCQDCGRHWFPLVHDPAAKRVHSFVLDFGHFNSALSNQFRSDPQALRTSKTDSKT